ncbi:MAG TPA: HAD family phosphatase [Dysgonomonas sp.]|nr:HAD family phosphatase [Dysgonomonas sp.]
MKKEICVLFDMDGVMIDTETQYDGIWREIGERYKIGIPHFEKVIKGTTLPNIINKYFSHLPASDQKDIEQEIDEFETKMEFPEIPGSLRLVDELKAAGIKVGLVTSSTQTKLNAVNKVRHFDELFDTIVAAERVVHGKPNPECYLIGARDLNVDPADCLVFEDSLNGIEAGKAAGMTVVGVATTLTADKLLPLVEIVIPDFSNFGLSDIEGIVK